MWDFPSAVPEILMIDAIDALLEISKDLRINHNSFFFLIPTIAACDLKF